jgi:hypothetical protein
LFRPRRAEQARRGAMDAGQYAAAVAAVKEKGVLSGKRVERRESGAPGGHLSKRGDAAVRRVVAQLRGA